MSYILEALKKSDQQRQQGAAPTLTSVQFPVEETPQTTFPWLVALAAVVFIAGIVIGWLQHWNSGQLAATVPPPAERVVVQAPKANPPMTVPAPVNAAVDTRAPVARNSAPIQSPESLQTSPPHAAPFAVPVQALPTPAKPTTPIVKDDFPVPAVRIPAVVKPEPVVSAKPAGVAEQPVIAKAELPPAIQQELPAMSVSLHAYSGKPSNRLVGINDKLLQEGDSLMPGLVLEEITRKDMIFSYKGFRFRQGVQ